MLPDGEKILIINFSSYYTMRQQTATTTGSIAASAGTVSSIMLLPEAEATIHRGVVMAGRVVASVQAPGSSGVVPADLGTLEPGGEGIVWARGWDQETADALLAAFKLVSYEARSAAG